MSVFSFAQSADWCLSNPSRFLCFPLQYLIPKRHKGTSFWFLKVCEKHFVVLSLAQSACRKTWFCPLLFHLSTRILHLLCIKVLKMRILVTTDTVLLVHTCKPWNSVVAYNSSWKQKFLIPMISLPAWMSTIKSVTLIFPEITVFKPNIFHPSWYHREKQKDFSSSSSFLRFFQCLLSDFSWP